MNGWLVVISTSMDDLPVCLTGSEDFARKFAMSCDPVAEVATVAEQRRIDINGDLICIRLQRFMDGSSVSDEVVRDLESEDDTKGGAS